MATFEEVSKQLSAALSDAASKKSLVNDLTSKLTSATNEYQAAVYKTQELRGQLNDILNQVLPAQEIKPKIG